MSEQFRQQIDLWGSYRPLIISSVVVIFLVGFLGAAVMGMSIPDSPTPLRWLVGIAFGIVLAGLVLLARTAKLKRAASSATLDVDARGLVARYQGTTRTLAWEHVERFGQVKRLVKDATKTDTAGGASIIGAVNAAQRATAPTSIGVIGIGQWTQDETVTPIGRELLTLSADHFGRPDTGAIVPIWFKDYDETAQRRLRELVAQHRPDLVESQ